MVLHKIYLQMKKIILGLSIFSLLFATACDDDDNIVDTDAPSITLLEPTNGESFDAGGEIHFEAQFADNVSLATYRITIHDNFDGHAHGRVAQRWDFEQTFEITGLNDDVHEDIEVPTDVTAGPYHFIVEAIDSEGNSTNFADGSSVEIELWAHNTSMAHIHFEDDMGNKIDEIDGDVGQPLVIHGHIEDPVGTLDHVTVMVGHMEEGHSDHDHDHGRIADEGHIFDEEFEVDGQSEVELSTLLADHDIVLSQENINALEGDEHYYLIVRVEDADGNISRNYIELHVH